MEELENDSFQANALIQSISPKFDDHSRMVQKVSEKDLDILELKKNFLNEISVLKSLLQKKEGEILTKDSKLRRLSINFEELKSANEDLSRKYSQLKVKQQKIIKESLNQRKKASEQSLKLNKSEFSFSEVIQRKDHEIQLLSQKLRETEDLSLRKSKKLENKERQFKESEHKLKLCYKEKNRKLLDQLSVCEAAEVSLKKQVSIYKTRHMEVSTSYNSLRHRHERTELLANKLQNNLDDALLKINKLKSKIDFHKIQTAQSKKCLENKRSEDVLSRKPKESDRLREQLVRMKKELSNCLQELNDLKSITNENNLNGKPSKKDLEINLVELEKDKSKLQKKNSELHHDNEEITSAYAALRSEYTTLLNKFNSLCNEKTEVSINSRRECFKLCRAMYCLVRCMVKTHQKVFRLKAEIDQLVSLVATLMNEDSTESPSFLESKPYHLEELPSMLAELSIGDSAVAKDFMHNILAKLQVVNFDWSQSKEFLLSGEDFLILGSVANDFTTVFAQLENFPDTAGSVQTLRNEIVEKYTERVGGDCISQ